MDKPDQPSDKPTGTYISPKLREKLEEESGSRPPRDEDQLPSWLGWVVLALLIVAGAAVAFGVIQSNAEKKRQQEAAREAARADSLRAIAVAESIETARRDTLRAESLAVAQGIRKPRPTPAPAASAARGTSAPAAGAGEAVSAPAEETRRYGLIVAEFIDDVRANEEKDKLSQSTGLPGRVISVDGGNAFRVILGSFEGRAAAERAAADLSGKGLVSQAQVTALPR